MYNHQHQQKRSSLPCSPHYTLTLSLVENTQTFLHSGQLGDGDGDGDDDGDGDGSGGDWMHTFLGASPQGMRRIKEVFLLS